MEDSSVILRQLNNALANACQAAKKLGKKSLATYLERHWNEVAAECEEAEEVGGQQQAAA